MKTRMQGLIGLGLALTAASGAAAADKPVFGLVMSFSGWFQPIDADTIAGAKLAVDDINAAGGVLGQPIEIVQFDNKSDPPLGPDGAIDVINKGAKAILFPSDFDFGAPGAYVAQQNNVIAFSAASDPKFGVQGVGPLAYSVSNAAQAQGALMAEWAYKTKGWRTGYVLLDNTISYTKSLCGSFATRWKELGGDQALLGQDTFLNSDPSIASQITRIPPCRSLPTRSFSAPTHPAARARCASSARRALMPRSSLANRWTAITGSAACRTSAISTS
jgi:branched-chain amino acid transport system substrate-binding protein